MVFENSTNHKTRHFDVVIVGGGLAAVSLALSLPERMQVAILCKDNLMNSASCLAQGGIAAVLSKMDSVEQHAKDTLIAGAGLCDEDAVRAIISQSRQAIEWLCELGVPFTRNDNSLSKTFGQAQSNPMSVHELHLTKEGGHSLRRICHVADFTGHAVMQTLIKKLHQRTNIDVIEQCFAVDILKQDNRCVGVLCVHADCLVRFYATQVVMATGGLGQVYQYTTAPQVATGDGVAMAWRAGARIANAEFIQFHPTGLALDKANTGQTPLISEAVRGEGGVLKNHRGERFMAAYDARLELAPRDVVARSIVLQMQKNQHHCVYLDISHQPRQFIQSHFPKIYETCLRYGVDMTHEPIPVAPVQHYFCGGVLTDVAGRSDIEQLYCIGELACTGLHGANRLASNSLLECIVMAKNAAQALCENLPWQYPTAQTHWTVQRYAEISQNLQALSPEQLPQRQEIQRQMQKHGAVIRQSQAVAAVVAWLQPYALHSSVQLEQFLNKRRAAGVLGVCDKAVVERVNLATCAYLISDAAAQRSQSVGCHYWQR